MSFEQDEQSGGNIQTPDFVTEDNEFQATKYFFTYHIQSDESFEQAFTKLEGFYPLCKTYIFAEEHGKSGDTPHIQGACVLKVKMRASTISKDYFKNPVASYKLKSWKRAFEYCCKENGRKVSSETVPEPIECMKILKTWQQECYDIYNCKPDHRSIHWFYGGKNTGKTEMVRYMAIHHKIPFSYGGSVSDVMNLAFNNIKGCKAFIFCLTRIKKNRISYDALEQLKDGLISNNKYETGCFVINRPHVFVFSNVPPEDDEFEERMSSDRFVLHAI